MFIDTHAHLDDEKYNNDLDETIKRAVAAGVDSIINVGTDILSSRKSVEISEKYPSIYAAAGIHPHSADTFKNADINELEETAKNPKVVAIGETGLDYFHKYSSKENQELLFRALLRTAGKLSLPVILHCRDANADVMRVLKEENAQETGGVLHCFSGDEDILDFCLNLGYYVAVGGAVTFPKADKLRNSVKKIPITRLLLETDCPYLAPQSNRGKRNEPSFIPEIAGKISEVMGLSVSDIGSMSSTNAGFLFGIGADSSGKISYKIRNSLYLNITNRCSNSCDFCVRYGTNFVKGHNLRIKKEPSAEEIIKAVGDPVQYDEIVFCGYGEPLIRLETVKKICKSLKAKGAKIRIDTNGQANLIHGRNIVPELDKLVDAVSVSLNADEEVFYDKICRSQYGKRAYKAVKTFIFECKKVIPDVTATAVTVPGADILKCENVAKELGVKFKVREYGKVG